MCQNSSFFAFLLIQSADLGGWLPQKAQNPKTPKPQKEINRIFEQYANINLQYSNRHFEVPKVGRDCFPIVPEIDVAFMAALSRLVWEPEALLLAPTQLFELERICWSRVDRLAEFCVEV